MTDRPNKNLSCQALANAQSVVAYGDNELALLIVRNHIDLHPFSQTHGHEAHLRPPPADKLLNHKPLPGLGVAKWNQIRTTRQTVRAYTVNFHFMLKHVKPLGGGDVLLETLQVVIFEFYNVSASGADHMVMVLAKMPMLVSGLCVLELSFLGKSEPAHHIQGLSHELIGKIDAVFAQQLMHLLGRDVLFSLQKCFENLKTVFEFIDV
jgi:hypothetical protein